MRKIKILRDLCDWEMFNSRNLDKFANSISKLLVGKDPLKDTFILFERILASKSDQSNKIAVSIKQDMLPFLQKAINFKDQNMIKCQQSMIRQLKTNMLSKIRQLYNGEQNYKMINQKMRMFSSSPIMQSRQQIEEMTKLKREVLDSQSYLTQVINIYNHSVQDYMLNYTKLCEQLSQIESNRKTTIKESISKYIVFEMDALKNIEYDLSRYAKNIQKMQDKLVIQDKVSQNPDLRTFQLTKISSSNYIMHLTQRQNKNQSQGNFQTQSQKKLNQIKKFLDPLNSNLQLSKQSFNNLLLDINQLLTEAIQVYDIKTLKQIVHYSTNYYQLSTNPSSNLNQSSMFIYRRTKIFLLNAIICHPIFKNQPFWEKYSNRLSDIVQRQINTTNSIRKSDQMRLSLSFLASDIDFMRKISIAPIVEKLLYKYQKLSLDSSEHILKSSDSIKSRTDSTQSKQKSGKSQKTSKLQISNFQERVKIDQMDCSYF